MLVVVCALVYRSRGAIRLKDFSWERLGHSMREARGGLLLVSLAAIFASYALRAVRWVRFSRRLGRASFWNVYSATLMGFAAVFLLGRVGEPVRPVLIARKERLPVSSEFGIYVLERVFDTASTVVVAVLGLLLLQRPVAEEGEQGALIAAARATGVLLLLALVAMVTFLVYFRLRGAGALERKLVEWRTAAGWRRRLVGVFTGFSEGLQAMRTWADLLAATAYSAAHWVLVTQIYVWVAHSFGGRLAQLDFAGALLVLAFAMVGSTLQLPGVGGGSQVATFLAFTGVFGVEKEPAAAASIVLWLVTFAASSLVGVPLLIREGWSMGELRRLARAEAEAEATGAHAEVSEPPREDRGEPVKPGEAPR